MVKIALKPQPYSGVHKFVKIKDPWHPNAFKGTPVAHILQDLQTGKQQDVWAAEDFSGNIVAILNQQPPHPAATVDYDDILGWCWIFEEMP